MKKNRQIKRQKLGIWRKQRNIEREKKVASEKLKKNLTSVEKTFGVKKKGEKKLVKKTS